MCVCMRVCVCVCVSVWVCVCLSKSSHVRTHNPHFRLVSKQSVSVTWLCTFSKLTCWIPPSLLWISGPSLCCVKWVKYCEQCQENHWLTYSKCKMITYFLLLKLVCHYRNELCSVLWFSVVSGNTIWGPVRLPNIMAMWLRVKEHNLVLS